MEDDPPPSVEVQFYDRPLSLPPPVEVQSYDRPPSTPPPPSASLPPPSVEIPIYSPFDEPPPYEPQEDDHPERAAPVYELSSNYLRVKVGQSSRTEFTVTSKPPLPCNPYHIITHRDGRAATSRFKVEDNIIMFDDVRESDSDIYIISCKNSAGLQGKVLIQLEVYEGWSSSDASVTLSTPVVIQQPISSSSVVVNPEAERGRKLDAYMTKWFFIYYFVVLLGVICFWALPCCIGVIAAFCVASVNYDNCNYEESEKSMKVANYCLVWRILSSVVGIVVLIITLSIVV